MHRIGLAQTMERRPTPTAKELLPGCDSCVRGRGSLKDALHVCVNDRARGMCVILCSSSGEKRGFGAQRLRKDKDNRVKVPKEGTGISQQPRKSTSKRSEIITGQAPGLGTGTDGKSRNVVFDRNFEERLEAAKRSALEKKRANENEQYQAIDYDAPIETEQNVIGLGAKVGVGIAVVVFGLVFALGDFLPSESSKPSEEATVVDKKITKEEKEALQMRLNQYEATLRISPKDLNSLEGAAVTLSELGEYDRAASLLEELTKERPKDVDAYRLLGEVKYELKDYDGSATAYKRSLSVSDSSNFEVLRGLTNALLSAKKPDEAVQVLLASRDQLNTRNQGKKTIPANGNNLDVGVQKDDFIQVELLLGKAYSDWGHVSDAVSIYDRLISMYPDDFRGYLAKGIILKENGKAGDAERMFIQARFFAPDKAKALVDRYSR